MVAEHTQYQELNNDQARELVNTRQRFDAWRSARSRLGGFKGSMSWADRRGKIYLLRDYYDPASGVRKQKSLGPQSLETEQLKKAFDEGKAEAERIFAERDEILLRRQAPVNRALGLGRVPLLAARIIRGLDEAGLLGHGLRIVGTQAIYAYEAAAGVFVDAGLTTTEDIDLLFDARRSLRMIVEDDVSSRSLMGVIRRVDRSFQTSRQAFRAINDEGFLVDLIKPMAAPPWREEADRVGELGDLAAAPIDGLVWHQNAPAFEAVAIDEKGAPVRMVVTDPRVFAMHKLWISRRVDRDPIKRRRDAAQAEVVAGLVAQRLTHLPFEADQLRMAPRELFDAAAPLFVGSDQ